MKRQNRQFTKFISLLKFPGLQYIMLIPTCHVMVSMTLTNQRRLRKGWKTPYAPDGGWKSVPGPLKRGQEKCSCPLLSGPGTHQERLFARFSFEMAVLIKPAVDLQFSDEKNVDRASNEKEVCVSGRGFHGRAR